MSTSNMFEFILPSKYFCFRIIIKQLYVQKIKLTAILAEYKTFVKNPFFWKNLALTKENTLNCKRNFFHALTFFCLKRILKLTIYNVVM